MGTRLKLRFTIMADDPEILEAMGEVVRVSERPRGMGVKFLELTERPQIIDRAAGRASGAPAKKYARSRARQGPVPTQTAPSSPISFFQIGARCFSRSMAAGRRRRPRPGGGRRRR